jgi:hypothetical protein
MSNCFGGGNVWLLVLHDFYSNNIWFTSLTLSNGSKNIEIIKIISYCVIKEITLCFSKVKKVKKVEIRTKFRTPAV